MQQVGAGEAVGVQGAQLVVQEILAQGVRLGGGREATGDLVEEATLLGFEGPAATRGDRDVNSIRECMLLYFRGTCASHRPRAVRQWDIPCGRPIGGSSPHPG